MFKVTKFIKRKSKLAVVINKDLNFSGKNKQELINHILTLREMYIKSFDKMIADIEIWATEVENNNV